MLFFRLGKKIQPVLRAVFYLGQIWDVEPETQHIRWWEAVWRGSWGARIYRSVCNKARWLQHQKITAKKYISQISQVKEFSSLCVWKNLRVWSCWYHPFDMHLRYVGPVSYVLSSWVSGASGRRVRAVVSAGWAWQWQSSLPPSLSLLRITEGLPLCEAVVWWLDGSSILVYRYSRQCINSHAIRNGCLTEWVNQHDWPKLNIAFPQ